MTYYTNNAFTSGEIAKATDLNTEFDLIETAFGYLPSETNIKYSLVEYGTDAGAADAHVVTMTHTISALTDGMKVLFKAAATNLTTTPTLNVDSTGAKTITHSDGSAVAIGEILINKFILVRYNSTSEHYEMMNGTINTYSVTGTTGLRVSANDTDDGNLNGKLVAGEGIDLTENDDGGNESLTVSCEDASSSNKGAASFASSHFSVSSGAVSLNDEYFKKRFLL